MIIHSGAAARLNVTTAATEDVRTPCNFRRLASPLSLRLHRKCNRPHWKPKSTVGFDFR